MVAVSELHLRRRDGIIRTRETNGSSDLFTACCRYNVKHAMAAAALSESNDHPPPGLEASID
ncbi:hypothetical protein RR48_07916 [Papilio machaon]|uniref:Uncharacterized protein n=1 Tax=Papilio machaon TaxID=76193 RepID=A0A194QNZ1_PAPMA|nr:hypothetical protein RR48_07916 [Papilio machaon]